ncbi:hypothetical protein M1328_00745 [Patescibacteria group bacterium]|nr:hypothetical protein [Patescibacteria group bacterium]
MKDVNNKNFTYKDISYNSKEPRFKSISYMPFMLSLMPMAFGWWDLTMIGLIISCVLFVIINFKEIFP